MNPWFVLGLFLLGAAAGALLTAIFYIEQLRRIKEPLPSTEHERLSFLP